MIKELTLGKTKKWVDRPILALLNNSRHPIIIKWSDGKLLKWDQIGPFKDWEWVNMTQTGFNIPARRGHFYLMPQDHGLNLEPEQT